MKRSLYAFLVAGALLSASGATFAQAAPAGAPVTREEFDKMMKEMTDLRLEVAQLKAERAAAAPAASTQPAAPGTAAEVQQLRAEVASLRKDRERDAADSAAYQDEIDKTIKDVMRQAKANSQGDTKLLITGDAHVDYTAQKGNPNSFGAGASPRLLWKLNDRLAFDVGLDIGLGRDDTGANASSFDLSIASATYIINDYLVVGGGLFVAPFAAYHRDFDPPWITKLPDDPLVFSDNGLAPGSVLGAFVSGAYPIGSTKLNYALYISNGPELVTSDPSASAGTVGAAGSLNFDNYSDLNNNKAIGGRVGFLPIPELEVGYSFLCGQASAQGVHPNTNAFLQAVDFNYTRQSDMLQGNLSLRGEWVFSHVGDATYDPQGNNTFVTLNNNNRNGGYVMLTYRPSLSSYKFLRNFEGIVRYDRLDGPSIATGGGHEQRYTIGLDYWLDARSVVKVAYEFDQIANGPGAPAFMMQFGVGF